MYALHTTQLNPAYAFDLLTQYRRIFSQIACGAEWDNPCPPLAGKAAEDLMSLGRVLVSNDLCPISEQRSPSYNDGDYNFIICTDASRSGWGAIARNNETGSTSVFQQRWIDDICGSKEEKGAPRTNNFLARHSAHAEPRAIQCMLQLMVSRGLPRGSKIAVITDHHPIVHAQRKLNGYGGIGRGYSLNKLYKLTYDLFSERNVEITFFYIPGPCNPADVSSRYFGVRANKQPWAIVETPAPKAGLPPLMKTYCPLCTKEA